MKALKYVAYLLKPIVNKCATKSKVTSQNILREKHNLQVMFGGFQSQDAYIIIPLRLTTIFFILAMANLHQDLPRHLHCA